MHYVDLLLVDYYRFDIEYLTILCLGGIGTFLTTPMDVVKTRIIAGPGSSYQYSNVMEAVVNILQGEGPGAFFIGTTPRLLHKIPANGLFFLCYEAIRKLLGVT